MKYFCNVNLKMDALKEEAIKLRYPRIKVLRSLDEMKKVIEPLDLAVFDNILELDPSGNADTDTIIENYNWFADKQVDVIFDRSPNCDLSILHTYMDLMRENGLTSDEKTMFKITLEMQIGAYINIKDATANMKKYAQLSASKIDGKAYGRPKGSTKDSERAVRAKEIILANSKDFNGTLCDDDCVAICGVSRNTFYRYKKQLKAKRGDEG